jgi:predicted NUDIX family NTP pyrophosphohydrolase
VKISAGILLWRGRGADLQVLLVHPGGPLWARKDAGAWSIPKGLVEAGESPEAAAVRELLEETGWRAAGPLVALGTVTLKSGKRVHGFAVQQDVDPDTLVSGTFPLQWPPGSGRMRAFPEVDRAAWYTVSEAVRQLNPAQVAFVQRLVAHVAAEQERP